MKCFLGIDLGLSSARIAVLDSHGELLGCGRSKIHADPGAAEHDPERWLDAIGVAVRSSLSGAGNPAMEAIGIGALGPCAVTVDADLAPLGKASLFSLDARAEPFRRKLIDSGIDESVAGPDHVHPKLMRLREADPQRFARASWVLDATGFLVASLTGVPVMDSITACDHVIGGVEPLRPLPPIRRADEFAGKVTAKAACRFGLAEGTPVCVGSYDSYVDLFGSGVSDIGDAGMLLGTTLVMGKVIGDGRCGSDLRITPHIGKGALLGGWTSSAGSLIDWSAALLGDHAVAAAPSRKPGGAGLLMLPYFAGERAPVWDPMARGIILGPTLTTNGADLHRAAIDAVALSAMDIARRIDEASGPTEAFRISGGGARNAALVEAIAHATGARLEIAAHSGEASAPAILAAHAAGVKVTARIERAVRPDRELSEIYDRMLGIYRPLYGKLREAMHAMGTLAQSGKAQ